MTTTLVEQINMPAMKRLLAHFDDLYDQGLISARTDDYKLLEEKEVVRTIITKFYNCHDDEGKAIVKYKPSKINPDGRVFAPYSLQSICRVVRHTVSKGIMIDIDIVKCHPNLVKHIMDRNSIECPGLAEYVNHSDSVLKQLIELSGQPKENVKQTILSIINGGGVDHTHINWFHSFHKEMAQLLIKIPILFPVMYERALKVGGNVLGRALNYELCRLEMAMLTKMREYAKKNKIKIASLNHDGFMPYEDPTRDYNNVCKELSKEIGMEVIVKPMDEGIDWEKLEDKPIPNIKYVNDTCCVIDPKQLIPYKEMKGEFENTFFKMMSPYCYVQDYDGVLYTWSHKDFTNCFWNKRCYGFDTMKHEMGNVAFPKLWMGDSDIRTYHHYQFDPSNKCKPDVYNQFKGLAITKLEGDAKKGQEGLKVFLEHLMNLCGNHQISYDYFEKWLTHGIKMPWKKTGEAVVFQSSQGSGKGTFAEYWGRCVIGDEWYTILQDIALIVGPYNAHKANKLLTVFDESDAKETATQHKSLRSAMKNYITGTRGVVNGKHKDPGNPINDYANVMFLSNEAAPVVLDQSDRRYVVFKCSDRYTRTCPETTKEEKDAYWNRLYKYIDPESPDPDTLAAIRDHFMKVDISDFSPEADRAITEAYNLIKSLTMPNELKFLYDYTISTASELADDVRDRYTLYLRLNELYTIYKKWFGDFNPQGKPLGKSTFNVRLKEYVVSNGGFLDVKINRNYEFYRWCWKDLHTYMSARGLNSQQGEQVPDDYHENILLSQEKMRTKKDQQPK